MRILVLALRDEPVVFDCSWLAAAKNQTGIVIVARESGGLILVLVKDVQLLVD